MAATVMPPDDGGDNRNRLLAEINVTPMVDVMLVLLVIFMVTAPLLMVGVPLDLPKTRAAPITATKQPVVLSLTRNGEVFIGDNATAPDELETRLAALASEDPDRLVYVRGDRSVTYAQLMDLLSEVNRAGFAKVSLVAQAAGAK
jgi:biopolymer transport protein ExbD